MAHEYVFGLLGPKCTSNARKTWNELLQDRGIDGFFDFYRTEKPHDLVTRFSEMFLLERRGYLIANGLQADAVPLMDVLTHEAKKMNKVDVVKNERGVLTGHFMGDSTQLEILDFWMKE